MLGEKTSNEMRLIDADAMKRVYQEVLCSHVACIDCSLFMDDKYCRFETMLSEAPTINAIPVVRCRECKHLNAEYRCVNWRGLYDYTKADDFCSYGERKEGVD